MPRFEAPRWTFRVVHGLWITALLLAVLTSVLAPLFGDRDMSGTIALA